MLEPDPRPIHDFLLERQTEGADAPPPAGSGRMGVAVNGRIRAELVEDIEAMLFHGLSGGMTLEPDTMDLVDRLDSPEPLELEDLPALHTHPGAAVVYAKPRAVGVKEPGPSVSPSPHDAAGA